MIVKEHLYAYFLISYRHLTCLLPKTNKKGIFERQNRIFLLLFIYLFIFATLLFNFKELLFYCFFSITLCSLLLVQTHLSENVNNSFLNILLYLALSYFLCISILS